LKRKFPASPRLRRSVNQIAPKVELVIACEGQNTEPKYIMDCAGHYGAQLVRIRVLPRTGVPLTVVKVAIEEREELLEERRKAQSIGEYRIPFKVWAVFDKDEHEVGQALALARENHIEVAFSNPCFEVWPLLHLQDYGAQDGRHAVQAHLHALMPGYHHERGALIDFHLIKDEFETALARAEKMNRARHAEHCENGCPSTTAGRLVLKIVQNGRFKFRKAPLSSSSK
jgi:hypothetical protein